MYTILSLFLAVSILQCQISLHKCEQVVDYSILYALLNFMKTNFLIAVYLVGIFDHLQWSILAPFRVPNAFNVDLSTFTYCTYF